MDFDTIIKKCIDIFSYANSDDIDCLKRYEKMVSQLKKMREAVKLGNYPRDYPVIPLFHYIERNMDPEEMYESVKELDKWYAANYRVKSEIVVRRERIRDYLLLEGGISEQRVDATINKLARHKEIYFEFAEYVTTHEFPDNGIIISGYSAKILHEKFSLSPLGAYNYLVYLIEMPEKALADLKAGLPTKDFNKFEQFIKDKEENKDMVEQSIKSTADPVSK